MSISALLYSTLYPSFLATSCILAFCPPVRSQEVLDNIRIEVKKNVIEIQYDLKTTEPGLFFKITAFYVSEDNSQHTMELVRGDVGTGVVADKNKTIIWEFRRELKAYAGEMQIQLKWEVIPPKVTIPLDRNKYKRSGKVMLSPEPINGNQYEITDMKREVWGKGPLEKNQHQYELKLPNTLEVGKPYRIRIENPGSTPAYTSTFTLRRKVPLSVQIGGAGLIVGGILYFILKPGPTTPPIEYPIPLPGP